MASERHAWPAASNARVRACTYPPRCIAEKDEPAPSRDDRATGWEGGRERQGWRRGSLFKLQTPWLAEDVDVEELIKLEYESDGDRIEHDLLRLLGGTEAAGGAEACVDWQEESTECPEELQHEAEHDAAEAHENTHRQALRSFVFFLEAGQQ